MWYRLFCSSILFAVAASATTRSVASYGATGNCSTNDASAIQATINASSAGDTVLFPAPSGGCYYRGTTTITLKSGSVGAPITYQGTSTSVIRGVSTSDSTTFALPSAAAYITIDTLTVEYGGVAVYFAGTPGTLSTYSHDVTIVNSTFKNIINNAGTYGVIYVTSVYNWTIQNNTFSNIWPNGTAYPDTPGGRNVSSGLPPYNTNGSTNCYRYAIFTKYCKNLLIDKNTFDSIEQGLGISFDSSAPPSSGYWGNIQVTDNTFTRMQRMSTEIQSLSSYGPNGVTVTGNLSYGHIYPHTNSFCHSVVPSAGSNVVVSNNVCIAGPTASTNTSPYDRYGICIELSGQYITAQGNHCRGGGTYQTGWGVSFATLYWADHITITGNNICGSNIYFSDWLNDVAAGTDKTYTGNTISGSYGQGACPAATISGVAVSSITTSAATVSWSTNFPATSRVDYGATTGYGSNQTSSTVTRTHSIALSGLSSGSTYHYKPSNTDTLSVAATGSDGTFETLGGSPPACSAATADDFSGSSLDAKWTEVDPRADGTVTVGGGVVNLSVPAGTSHDAWVPNNSLRIMQTNVCNTDMGFEVKFGSKPTIGNQDMGLIFEGASSYLRFSAYYDSNISSVHLIGAYITSTAGEIPLLDAQALGDVTYLRVIRSSNNWSLYYSADGSTYRLVGTFGKTITVTSVGVYAGTTVINPAWAPDIDYFHLASTPSTAPTISIQDKDGNPVTSLSLDILQYGPIVQRDMYVVNSGNGTLTWTMTAAGVNGTPKNYYAPMTINVSGTGCAGDACSVSTAPGVFSIGLGQPSLPTARTWEWDLTFTAEGATNSPLVIRLTIITHPLTSQITTFTYQNSAPSTCTVSGLPYTSLDYDTCPASTPIAAPSPAGTYTDPVMATTPRMLVASDTNHRYSMESALNSNGTYIVLLEGSYYTIRNPSTGASVCGSIPSGTSMLNWSATDPGVLYRVANDSAVIKKYTVSTCSEVDWIDMSSEVSNLIGSEVTDSNSMHWGFACDATERKCCAYNLVSQVWSCTSIDDVSGPTPLTNFQGSLVSKGRDVVSGKIYAILPINPSMIFWTINEETGALTFSHRGPKLYDGARDYGTGECEAGDTCLDFPHVDTYADAAGNQYLIIPESGMFSYGYSLWVVASLIRSGNSMRIPMELGGGAKYLMPYDYRVPTIHFGCAKSAPYCLVSNTSAPSTYHRDGQQIVFYLGAGSAWAKPVARQQNTYSGYWDQARGCMSGNGGMIAWDQNFGSIGDYRTITLSLDLFLEFMSTTITGTSKREGAGRIQ